MSQRYDASSAIGRTLLALRAGQMTSGELDERFGRSAPLTAMAKHGLVTGDADGWSITDAGRAACPLRNPLAAKTTPAPHAALPRITSGKLPTEPRCHVSTGDQSMNKKLTAVDQVRKLLAASPDGITRKDLIKQSALTETAVDNAIFNLTKSKEAFRPAYGIIASTQYCKPVDIVAPVPASPAPVAETPAQPEETNEDKTPDIEFSIYDDGRLAITDGDEILVLPPNATRRLGHFLGCFDMSQHPKQTAA